MCLLRPFSICNGRMVKALSQKAQTLSVRCKGFFSSVDNLYYLDATGRESFKCSDRDGGLVHSKHVLPDKKRKCKPSEKMVAPATFNRVHSRPDSTCLKIVAYFHKLMSSECCPLGSREAKARSAFNTISRFLITPQRISLSIHHWCATRGWSKCWHPGARKAHGLSARQASGQQHVPNDQNCRLQVVQRV